MGNSAPAQIKEMLDNWKIMSSSFCNCDAGDTIIKQIAICLKENQECNNSLK